MELKPTIGLDNIKFGMFQKMVYQILGLPDKIRIDEDDSDNIYMEYNNLKLRLTIYKNEDNRLGYLCTSNPNLTYNNFKIIDCNVDWVKTEIFGDLIQNWEIDDYDTFSTHGDDKCWITLNVEYGRVISLELGTPWKNEEEYEWPQQWESITN
ncbi:MAG: hypothetical protein ABJN84_07040 [Flavobacteriaceae bacterium]